MITSWQGEFIKQFSKAEKKKLLENGRKLTASDLQTWKNPCLKVWGIPENDGAKQIFGARGHKLLDPIKRRNL